MPETQISSAVCEEVVPCLDSNRTHITLQELSGLTGIRYKTIWNIIDSGRTSSKNAKKVDEALSQLGLSRENIVKSFARSRHTAAQVAKTKSKPLTSESCSPVNAPEPKKACSQSFKDTKVLGHKEKKNIARIVVGSGRIIDVASIKPSDISIVDIGHALSNTCRWLGHSNYFYSVAQHSVLVSRHVSPEHALWGLLHDAAEAYLTDLPAPIKGMFPEYKELENKVMKAICTWAELPDEEPHEVKLVDRRLRVTESITLGLHPHLWGGLDVDPLPILLQAEPCYVAKDMFFERWKELTDN